MKMANARRKTSEDGSALWFHFFAAHLGAIRTAAAQTILICVE
jgi:hypothetical protein